jgi:hypothetical protein
MDDRLGQVVDDLYALDGLADRCIVDPIARQDSGVGKSVRNEGRLTGRECELVPRRKEPRDEAAAHVPAGADDEDVHRPEYAPLTLARWRRDKCDGAPVSRSSGSIAPIC